MIIERISENQVKFTLNENDLTERDIKLTELAYGTEKTQALFREMMEQANAECGFEAENTPLLIEAVPLAADSIVIIVTKVTNAGDIEEKFSMLPRSKNINKFKPKGLIDTKNEKVKSTADDNISIFSFTNLDDVANVSLRLSGVFNGSNILFKNENKYFLLLENNSPIDSVSNDDLDALLSEYGQRHVSSVISKYYLCEHGEVILKNPALKLLATYYK